jgi:hypothetical protein
MNEFWNNIPEPKFDITQYGHLSGTGVVFMSNPLIEFVCF